MLATTELPVHSPVGGVSELLTSLVPVSSWGIWSEVSPESGGFCGSSGSLEVSSVEVSVVPVSPVSSELGSVLEVSSVAGSELAVSVVAVSDDLLPQAKKLYNIKGDIAFSF